MTNLDQLTRPLKERHMIISAIIIISLFTAVISEPTSFEDGLIGFIPTFFFLNLMAVFCGFN